MKTEGRQRDLSLWRSYLTIIIVCAVGVLFSYFIGANRYIQRIILLILVWGVACSAFNIISGYGGQIVFGYMMFVGSGAYSTVLLFKLLGVSPWLGMWIGAVIAAVVALIIGLPTLRLHGAYFAMATIAFPLITIPILNHLGFEEVSIPFTGHGAGSMQFRDMRYYVLIAAVLLAGTLIIIRMMENSSFGFRLRALKQNETAAKGMGINTHRVKLLAFMLSAALGAVTGAVYAFGILFILSTHSTFGLFIIVRILSISILGGLATVWGPVLASAILVPMGEFLNHEFGDRYPGVQDIIYGAALVAAIIYMPEGIWGKIQRGFRRLPKKSTPVGISTAPEVPNENRMDNQKSLDLFKLEPFQTRVVKSSTNVSVMKLENICKSFGGVTALLEVSFEVPPGKILGVIGPNGAGKTTLFNVINGYLTPERGRVYFEGEDVTHVKPHSLCKMGVGRTFQTAQIFSNMTILENIMIGALAKESYLFNARANAEEIAQRMGLSMRANDKAVGLSILETKTLEFSRALATQPKLLLVDEPMAGLNPEEANRIGEIIIAIARSGITVMVIEHVVQNLVKISDYMVGLDEGRKVAEGTPEEVTSNPRIIEAYLGVKWRERYAKR